MLFSLQCIGLVCSKQVRSDLVQEGMLVMPNVILFQFQTYPPQVELFEIWHYHILKERYRQWLQLKLPHEVSVSRLHTFGLPNCHSEWCTGLYVHLCWFQLKPLVNFDMQCDLSRMNVGFRVFLCLHSKIPRLLTLQVESGLGNKHYLRLITLLLISIFSILVLSDLFDFAPFDLLPKAAIFAAK